METWRNELYLKHYGVKGMKWRHHKSKDIARKMSDGIDDDIEGVNSRPRFANLLWAENVSEGILIRKKGDFERKYNRVAARHRGRRFLRDSSGTYKIRQFLKGKNTKSASSVSTQGALKLVERGKQRVKFLLSGKVQRA